MTSAALHHDTLCIAMSEFVWGRGHGSCAQLSPQTFSIVQFNIYVVDELLRQTIARGLCVGLAESMFIDFSALR
jgi:hypothetical protein